MKRWTWAAASCRGTSHIRTGSRRQDAYSCSVGTDNRSAFIGVVCDGAGSASHGGEGASLACRIMQKKARQHFQKTTDFPIDAQIDEWIESVRSSISTAALNRTLGIRDFAATLIFVISTGKETLVVHIGDGGVVVLDKESGEWKPVSWPAQGEYASTTFFITDEPSPSTRIIRQNADVSAIALFSDGIERIALNFSLEQAHRPFFEGVINPVMASEIAGRDMFLSQRLARFLDSDSVNKRTDDDKTLILAVCK